MNISRHRRSSGLTCLAAAGIVFTIGLGAAIVTTDYSPPVQESNSADFLLGRLMSHATPADQALACISWIKSPQDAISHWVDQGVNQAGLSELAAAFNSYCTIEV